MATDADWGKLYSFSSDAGLLMPFRSYYIRDFVAGDWNDFAIGLILLAHGTTTPPSDLVNERQSETDPSNLFHFGLTTDNGTNQIQSVGNNPFFIGLRGIIGGVTQISTSPTQLAQLYLTLVNHSVTQTVATPLQLPLNNHGTSNPFSMVGLRFTRDKANQQIYINFSTQANLGLTADSDDVPALTTFIEAIPNTFSTATAQFTLNSVANFSTYYIYWPYQLNRLALHCVGAIQFG